MPRAQRTITREDLISNEDYGRERKARRADLRPAKTRRRVAVGPYCTFYFESYDTMLHQVQEMLFVEQGGEAQIEDELTAYNPLIPQGSDLSATMMFEISDPTLRASVLGRLGGVEGRVFLDVNGVRIPAEAEEDVDRTSAEGKASSVHFLHFRFDDAAKAAFKEATEILLGVDHPEYGHIAMLTAEAREELAQDLD